MNARTVVAWIVRFGLVPGKGRYHNGLAPPSDTITSATRYVTANGAADVAFRCGGRVVALVRRELGAASRIERLSLDLGACQADRDAWKARAEEAEGRIDTARPVYEEQARREEREACTAWLDEQGYVNAARRMRARGTPAPARVLRDGEGGCEPLPTPPKPQPAAGLYALSEVGYVLTRRGCDLLDALAREVAALRADLAAAVARAEAAERMVETQRAMLAFDATPGTEQRLRADLAAANARLAAAPSRDVPCVTCGHSIMVHQNNEAGGPCGRCDCEDGALLVNPPKL